jgi:iron(II)-dependent oxidoreductase
MWTDNSLTCRSAVAGPLSRVFGSVMMRFPGWLTGGVSSARPGDSSPTSAAPVSGRGQDSDSPEDEQPLARPRVEGDPASLVDEMLVQSRYALLLRRQLIGNLNRKQLARTREALAQGMCLVPAGEVALHRAADDSEDEGQASVPDGIPLRIAAYYLDRYPVTNSQFYHFVSSGGYEQMAIWDREILAAVLDFVDQTGHPGPRFWRNGRYPKNEGKHPVVGLSWYEAAAYARWAGKRLATDAEWVKAGSWPVAIAGHPLVQRRYPWGDAMDRSRANLWGSGAGRTVSVEQFPLGVSVGGVQQLIGNVWEWTADCFAFEDDAETASSAAHAKMKSLRGGAFDTYLDNQATCHFRSADQSLARKHNIGFRCAISLCDVANRDGSAEPARSQQP